MPLIEFEIVKLPTREISPTINAYHKPTWLLVDAPTDFNFRFNCSAIFMFYSYLNSILPDSSLDAPEVRCEDHLSYMFVARVNEPSDFTLMWYLLKNHQ